MFYFLIYIYLLKGLPDSISHESLQYSYVVMLFLVKYVCKKSNIPTKPIPAKEYMPTNLINLFYIRWY